MLAWVLLFGQVAMPAPWEDEWAVQPGFSLEADAEGFVLPVTLQFVPEPAAAPKAPRYFVAEIGGRIVAVANDGTVSTFADDFFALTRDAQMPALEGTIGLFGMCLDAEHGYVFATYVADTKAGRHNAIARFETTPRTFEGPARAVHHIEAPFRLGDSAYERFPNGHQIGQCQVSDGLLYVGTGDGELPERSRSPTSSFGKLLRFTLDGAPAPDNPRANGRGVEPFLYAWGLRNPFGQVHIGRHLVVADNGPGVDRVLRVERGNDYLYDGSDLSIQTNPLVLFSPARGLAHIDWVPGNPSFLPPDFRDRVFVVRSGPPEIFVEDERPEIVAIGFDPKQGIVTDRPRTVARYIGDTLQSLGALAVGSDGLYFAPLYTAGGPAPAPVLRLAWNPDRAHTTVLDDALDPRWLVERYGCAGCHAIHGQGTGKPAPPLDPESLGTSVAQRLADPGYLAALDALDARSDQAAGRSGRAAVREATDGARVFTWTVQHILEPKFDEPATAMPRLGVQPAEAEVLAHYLLEGPARRERPWMSPRTAIGLRLGVLYGLGLLTGVLVMVLVHRVRAR